ncbi:MAG: EI24 domain-containing protein, partial [Pseudomonadota bacterium]|nr:EI24 domain-containing protein [Pseudomonadota bacterium]
MLKALSNTVAQLSEPSLRKILFYSVLLALASIVICSGLGWVLLDQFGLLVFGFLDSFLPWIGASLIIVMGLVFFPSTIMLVASLFSDRIIRAVEEKYYPENIGTVHVPLTSSIKTSLTLIVIASIVNICLLPFYALGMILPGLSFIIFYLGNGYLLGRELFETVAQRHLPANDARKLRKQYFLKVLIGGGLITFLAT